MSEEPAAAPAAQATTRASDVEREATVTRLQTAVGEGRIDLDEFGQRIEAAYAAGTTAELDALLADLPAPGGSPAPELVGTAQPETLSSVFGDVHLTLTTSVPERVSTVFGDVKLDLRGLRSSADTVHLQLTTLFGDVEVVVSEGVTAEISGFTLFGDRRTELAAVPRLAGTPHVVVRGWTLFGDLRLRSLAPGESPSRWRGVLDRLAARRPPLPPTPPRP